MTGRKTGRLAPAQLWSLALSCLAVALVTAAMVALYSALPPIAADTGATQAQLTCIVDGYALALACLVLPGGALGDRYGRRKVMVVAGAVLAAAGCTVAESADESRPAIDLLGTLFAATAVGLIVVAATEVPEHGWLDPRVLGLTGAGIGACAVFVAVELRVEHPLPVAPWLAERVGLRLVTCAGLAVTAIGMFGLGMLTVDSTYIDLFWPLMVIGLGLALSATPATAAIVAGIPVHKHGVAAAVNDATREVGAAVGIAIVGSVLAAGYSDRIAALTPMLPEEIRGTVSDSLAAALRVTDAIGPSADPIADQAKAAFAHGSQQAAIALGVVALITAAVTAVWTPGRRRGDTPTPLPPPEISGDRGELESRM
ncbi:MFS transporter [Nocardia noduli]|uniref:MFS transporter n=1 Tax=Nocardia noduli TaxID=2815722 RepID=UPI0027E067E3|nr:MFS transporter [Nocardia noduli]